MIRDANGDPYLIRYFIWKPGNKNWGRIYLHRIIRSDYDRALHDHPWNFLSIMLWGRYTEYADDRQVPQEKQRDYGDLSGKYWKTWTRSVANEGQVFKTFTAPCVLKRGAGWRHRLMIFPGESAWTLVFIGRKVRDWGFWTSRTQWCWWKRYDTATGICEEPEVEA